MTGAMSSFKRVLRQAFKHLKPGAYMECHELDPKPKCDDDTMPPENRDGGYSAFAMHDWVDLNVRSGRDADPPRQFRIAHRISQWMKDIGFVDVEQRLSKIPTNTWPEDEKLRTIGAWSESNWLDALSGWSYKPFLALGWSKPEIEVFLVDVRKSIQDRSVHAYMDFYVVTGRKPLPNEVRPASWVLVIPPAFSSWLSYVLSHRSVMSPPRRFACDTLGGKNSAYIALALCLWFQLFYFYLLYKSISIPDCNYNQVTMRIFGIYLSRLRRIKWVMTRHKYRLNIEIS